MTVIDNRESSYRLERVEVRPRDHTVIGDKATWTADVTRVDRSPSWRCGCDDEHQPCDLACPSPTPAWLYEAVIDIISVHDVAEAKSNAPLVHYASGGGQRVASFSDFDPEPDYTPGVLANLIEGATGLTGPEVETWRTTVTDRRLFASKWLVLTVEIHCTALVDADPLDVDEYENPLP